MIQLVDLEDSADSTPGTRVGAKKEEGKQASEHNEGHDNDSLTSEQSIASHLSNKFETDIDERHTSTSELVKASRDPTLSWFAGACHVWQSTEDELEEKRENEEDIKSKEKRDYGLRFLLQIFLV